MGPLFQIFGWLLFYFMVGVILASVCLLIYTFFLNKENSKKAVIKKHWIKFVIIIFSFSTILSLAGTGKVIYDIESSRNDYWHYDGGWEFYRMPLEYPYELYINSSFKSGSLENWENNKRYTDGITSFMISNNIMLGRMQDKRYFLFQFKNKQLDFFEDIDSFDKKCIELNITDSLDFKPVRIHFSQFMKDK